MTGNHGTRSGRQRQGGANCQLSDVDEVKKIGGVHRRELRKGGKRVHRQDHV